MADPDNEPDFYAIDRLFPLTADGNNNKLTLGNTPLLGGLGGQQQQNPLWGGLSNFQQLPPGLLAMAASPQASATTPNMQQGMSMNQGTMVGNFINQPRLGQMNNPMGDLMPLQQQQQAVVPTNMNDPKFLAALLQQQHQVQQQHQQVAQMQQTMSTQRAQSSFMRFM